MEDVAAGRSCYTTSIAQFLRAYSACQMNMLQLKRLDTPRTVLACGPVHVSMRLRLPRKVRQAIHCRTIHIFSTLLFLPPATAVFVAEERCRKPRPIHNFYNTQCLQVHFFKIKRVYKNKKQKEPQLVFEKFHTAR